MGKRAHRKLGKRARLNGTRRWRQRTRMSAELRTARREARRIERRLASTA